MRTDHLGDGSPSAAARCSLSASARSPGTARRWKRPVSWATFHRPGTNPRARNKSASQAGVPGAFGSRGCGSDGRLATRQRIRAPLKLAVPLRRTSQQGTPVRSAATARRRVAVKSNAAGSPHSSPMTALKAQHLSPSSIAQSASRASRASTWIRWRFGSPAGWIRPPSKIAIRSWIQSRGLSASSCGSRKPAQPPSRGDVASSSLSVGRGVAGRQKEPPRPIDPEGFSAVRRVAHRPSRGWSFARLPPATRESSAATRLATHMFFFCSYSRESVSRVKASTRNPSNRR